LHNPRALGDVLHDQALLDKLDPAELPALLGELERLKVELLRRLLSPVPPTREADGGDRLLDVAEAAERLGVSRHWMYRRTRPPRLLPFIVRHGRLVRFSLRGIEKYLRLRSVDSA
jgi:predicted DNA-binding transcriptional regulator AlpA